MNKTINGRYDDPDQATNTLDDLVGTGIPRDKVYIDEANRTIKVMVPDEVEAEIQEIFSRHGVSAVS